MKNPVFRMGTRLKLSIASVVMEGVLSASNFLVLQTVLNLVFSKGIDYSDILKATGILAAIFVLRLVMYVVGYTGSQLGGSDVSKRIRIAIGDKLNKVPLGLFTKNRTGHYINAATSEVDDYEQILTHKIADMAKYCITAALIGGFALSLYWPMGLATLASSLLLIPGLMLSFHYVFVHGTKKNLAREENVSAITEYLTGSQTLRSYSLAGEKNESLIATMQYFSTVSYKYEKAVLPTGFGFHFCSYIALAAAVLLSAEAWLSGQVDPAALVLLIMLPLYVGKINMTLFIQFTGYRNLRIAKDKIETIFDEKEEPQEDDAFVPANSDICFKNVEFAYKEGEPVLKRASFTIRQRSLTAIVGDSGAGKSTIFNLIAKYYLPQRGAVYIGDKNSAQAPAEQVLRSVSQVDQDAFLFNASVQENIRYAREDATDEEIEAACVLANCDSFIRQMEKGYDTEIGENGLKLSGGERQRLSVARAIIKNSPIILLDEATASLDIENELLVKEAISHLLKTDKTVVIIAHTLPIIKDADKILVLDGGVISECGTHDELVALKGKYAAMWEASQRLK